MTNKILWAALVVLVAGCGGSTSTEECGALTRSECLQRADCEPTGASAQAGQPTGIREADRAPVAPPPTECRTRPTQPPACSTLTETQCGQRADCQVEQLACIALCQPDGNGGCAPCPQTTRCVPATPPACTALDVSTCRTRPDCAVSTSPAVGTGEEDVPQGAPCYCDPAQGPCSCAPPITERCVPAPVGPCDSLDVTTCSTRSDCHLESFGCEADCAGDDCFCQATPRCVSGPQACSALDLSTCSTRPDCRIDFSTGEAPPDRAALDGGGFQDPAPPAPAGRCVDAGPSACWQLDAMTCTSRPDCSLNEVTACPSCLPGAPCPPCQTTLVCEEAQGPVSCSQRDVQSCEAAPECMIEEVTACPACVPGSMCPPCFSTKACVARPPQDVCNGLGAQACTARPDCMLEEVGVCPACTGPGCECSTLQVCVSRPPQDVCTGLDIAACAANSACVVEEATVCPACLPGSMCPPCTTSFFCAPAVPVSVCAALDPVSCEANPACELEQWACTTECRDDGDGGCLPCDAPPASCRDRVGPPLPLADAGVR